MRFYPIKLPALIVLFLMQGGYAQDNERYQYELKHAEVRLYQRYNPKAASTALLDSAAVFAEQGEYLLAVIFLDEWLAEPGAPLKSDVLKTPESKPLEILLASGVDYNRQEFEIGFMETDSVLSEQLNKPFVNLNIQYTIPSISKAVNRISIKNRYDKDVWQPALELYSRYPSWSGAFNVRYEQNKSLPDFTFLESDLQYYYTKKIGQNTEIRVSEVLRYKNYLQVSDYFPDYLKNDANLNLTRFFKYTGHTTIYYQNGFNESLASSHNDLREHKLGLNFTDRYFQFWTPALECSYNAYRFSYLSQDSLFSNTSRSVGFDLNNSVELASQFQSAWDLSYQSKKYTKKTALDADYNFITSDVKIMWQPDLRLGLEGGYHYEKKNHLQPGGEENVYISEQNYFGHGLLLGLDLQPGEGFLLWINSAYTWRRYPDADQESALTLYTDRNILNLFLTLSYRVTDKLTLEVFCAYDNDQDKDTDRNDTRSTILNAELQYRLW